MESGKPIIVLLTLLRILLLTIMNKGRSKACSISWELILPAEISWNIKGRVDAILLLVIFAITYFLKIILGKDLIFGRMEIQLRISMAFIFMRIIIQEIVIRCQICLHYP